MAITALTGALFPVSPAGGDTFARDAEAGLARIILRVRDNAAAQSLPKRLRR